MSLKMKLNIVNKHEYEEEDYREIIIKIPKETEKLEIDFKYLGLDYNNLSIQDTHVLECKIIDTEDPHFSAVMTTEIFKIIDKAKDMGYTTTYQDVKEMFSKLKRLSTRGRDKLLAILEVKSEKIYNIHDAIECADSLEYFYFYNDINNEEEYGRKLIEDKKFELEEIIDYIDLKKLGRTYIDRENGTFTNQGLLFEEYNIDDYLQGTNCKKEVNNEKEEEEEFE